MENLNKKQQKVFVLAGIPGSGKSTWIINQMEPMNDITISRDNIRFMLLKNEEEYFAHEDKVKNIFFSAIRNNTFISKEFNNIFIDATHLTPKARRQTMGHISPECYKIAVAFEVPLEVAIKRNGKRTGRAFVPNSVIRNMFNSYIVPTFNEEFDEIWHIDAEGNVRKEIKNE